MNGGRYHDNVQRSEADCSEGRAVTGHFVRHWGLTCADSLLPRRQQQLRCFASRPSTSLFVLMWAHNSRCPSVTLCLSKRSDNPEA